mmetsp:Transcript_37211/g.57149  ORF Transcript_37211/g.57149 Transcript_37211/m.57149 type:complete len:202 (+) Transcript_37211:138-743(+)
MKQTSFQGCSPSGVCSTAVTDAVADRSSSSLSSSSCDNSPLSCTGITMRSTQSYRVESDLDVVVTNEVIKFVATFVFGANSFANQCLSWNKINSFVSVPNDGTTVRVIFNTPFPVENPTLFFGVSPDEVDAEQILSFDTDACPISGGENVDERQVKLTGEGDAINAGLVGDVHLGAIVLQGSLSSIEFTTTSSLKVFAFGW